MQESLEDAVRRRLRRAAAGDLSEIFATLRGRGQDTEASPSPPKEAMQPGQPAARGTRRQHKIQATIYWSM